MHKIWTTPPAAAYCFRKYGVHVQITGISFPCTPGFFNTADLDSLCLFETVKMSEISAALHV